MTTDAEAVCTKNGWAVGDLITYYDGRAPIIVEITAIGRTCILGIECTHTKRSYEAAWFLGNRDWCLYRKKTNG